MFAYIKLIDDDKYDTIPLSLVYNHEQLKPPYNKSKQHWIMYENNSPKKGLLIYVEETKEALEKLISSKRPIVPAPRNQETASELSDANEGILRNKSDPVIDITPIVDQQLNQLHEKLAIIDNKTGNHDSDGKENLKPITNADNQNDDNLSKIITPPKREPTMKFDSSLAKTETVKEKKLKKSKKRKGDTGLPTETKSKKKKFRKTMIDKKLQQDKSVSSKTQKITSEKTLTISHANHGNDSKQGSDEKPNHSTATKGIKREHNDEPTEIAEVGMRNFSQGKDQTENESKENTKKIVHENSSQQQSKNEDGTSQTIDETADYNTNLLNDINKYLNDPPTVKVIDKGNIQQQHNVFDEASCSNTQTIKDKSKKNIKTSQQSLKPKKTKSGTVSKVKTKKKSDKAESRHEKLQYVIEQVEEMKKSVENFQQLASTAFQTLLSNWQQFQSTRAAIPSAVKAIDFENIQVPPLVGFIRSDTGMIHCGQNIWITTQDYTNAKAASSSESMFVKNIAMNIFTREVLKNSSITGNSSNRTKGPAKPKLDPTKMLAVRDIYRYYLAEHRKLPEKVINVKVDEYVEYIRQKIADLIRPPKKTPSEAAEATKDDKKNKKKLPKARKGKQDVSSSSESSDSGEDSEASDGEASDSEDNTN